MNLRTGLSNLAFVCLLTASLTLVIYSASANPAAGAKAVAKDAAAAAEQAHDAARKNVDIDTEHQHDADHHGDAMDAKDHAVKACGSCMMCDENMSINKAIATLMPTAGNEAQGTVMLEQVEGGVKVTANVTGLEPGSKHGIHVHETGDVSSEDGKAAGGHYNPAGHAHALADTQAGHAGDLGNLEADDQGNAEFSFFAEGITIIGMDNPVLGRAIIVHAADDGGQPTGNAGSRIAQGVIGVAE